MAKMKLKTVKRLPDFWLPVEFVLPDGNVAEFKFKVKHHTSDELKEITGREQDDIEFILAIATGWDLEDEFNIENVSDLVKTYPAAVLALMGNYMKALAGQRVKN
ncbi:putative tape measure chaperone [Vibrio phage Vc1]|uniref:Tape measure chaperone n=1 Tax=Vibrio phage Vc1 TaxID=1480731 RepID=A0A9X9SEN6_9CAUD|nr:putative tape measure chaperone [Vibrio virus 2019VC1]